MPSRHSKNSGDRGFFTQSEKKKAGCGVQTQRFGSDSQLPFGHCCLSTHPAEDPVVSPSGHLYGREAILEYLLLKGKEMKKTARLFDEQQKRLQEEERQASSSAQASEARRFIESEDGVGGVTKRKVAEASLDAHTRDTVARRRVLDGATQEQKMAHLSIVAPWVPQFTPHAAPALIKAPAERPPSPFSGAPLRLKDLISVQLTREKPGEADPGARTRFICPVSRKTITTQRVVLIKTSGVAMLEQSARELAYPSLQCPITGKAFAMADVLELRAAATGFASSGQVHGKIVKTTLN